MTIAPVEPTSRCRPKARTLAVVATYCSLFALCGCELMLLDAEKGEIYVERITQVPSMPECIPNIDDQPTAQYVVDLTTALENVDVKGWFLIKNSSLDGFVTDGIEIEVMMPDGEKLGGSEYRTYQNYISPGDHGVATGFFLGGDQVSGLAASLDCPSIWDSPVNWSEYKEQLEEIGVQGTFSFPLRSYVEFSGHAASGLKKSVLPVFEVDVIACCGCLLQMSNCADECNAFCEEPEGSTCSPGTGNAVDDVDNSVDCRTYFHNENSQWTEDIVWEDGGIGEETVDCLDC